MKIVRIGNHNMFRQRCTRYFDNISIIINLSKNLNESNINPFLNESNINPFDLMCALLGDLKFRLTKHYLVTLRHRPVTTPKIMLNVINTDDFYKAIRSEHFNPLI